MPYHRIVEAVNARLRRLQHPNSCFLLYASETIARPAWSPSTRHWYVLP
jgi:hypothetical protein